jgi:hypothetical protein
MKTTFVGLFFIEMFDEKSSASHFCRVNNDAFLLTLAVSCCLPFSDTHLLAATWPQGKP